MPARSPTKWIDSNIEQTELLLLSLWQEREGLTGQHLTEKDAVGRLRQLRRSVASRRYYQDVIVHDEQKVAERRRKALDHYHATRSRRQAVQAEQQQAQQQQAEQERPEKEQAQRQAVRAGAGRFQLFA